ncbi:MAG TPA: MFS transporter [Segeticoccus sp.]|uniref:MFS transporter n=1 Tax=Segeticoccus sp. TaxID=2706531 RepID=UPI002D804292|nr:MFS transporter [Segeticoccus sp.]HET8601095.1 MFS transporter [Segeticoccus sp.]
MSPTFRSLSIYNYRLYWTGALVSNIGTWMGRVSQDWLVLTDLTHHSSTDLGTVTALQFLPLVLLAPWAGAITDRFPKRRILFITQSALAVTSLLTGLLIITGVVQLWHIFALAFLQGVATAVDNPGRQTFVSEMVPRESLSNAVSLNSASFNAARLIGPGVAGLVIAAVGTGPSFFVNTLSFVAVLLALWRMRTSELRPAPRTAGRGSIREGARYVKNRPDIILIMVLVFMLGTFGMNFQLTTALMATQVFHKGAGEYGLLGSIMAIGSLAGALLAARRAHPRLRILLIALSGFAIATLVAATAPSYWMFAIFLVPTGLFSITVLTSANSMVQLGVDPAMRGRVMALYMAIFMGGTPIGAPVIGWIGDAFGARWTILIGTFAVAVSVVGAAAYLVRSENVHVRLVRDGLAGHGLPRFVLTKGQVTEPVPQRAA